MHARATIPPALAALATEQEGLFTTGQAVERGLSRSALHDARLGLWDSEGRGLWSIVAWAPPEDDRGRQHASARRRARRVQLLHPHAVACDALAAELLELDGWWSGTATRHLAPPGTGRRRGWRCRPCLPGEVVVIDGLRVTSAVRTLLDLAQVLEPDHLELVLEAALRRRLVPAAPHDWSSPAPALRALVARREGAPATESMLETLAVQLVRRVPGLPPPRRQVEVRAPSGRVVARVDLAWPDLGIFLELDGEHHLGQPVHDADRQSAVVALTGWLVVRWSWTAVTRSPLRCIRQLAAIAARARERGRDASHVVVPSASRADDDVRRADGPTAGEVRGCGGPPGRGRG